MKKKIIYIGLSLASIVGLDSCSNLLDINTNPNAPTVTVPDYVLAGAIIETARIKSQEVNAFSAFWAGYFAASGSYSQSGDVVRNYVLTSISGVCVNPWNSLFANAANYYYVESQVKHQKGYDYWVAVCKIMKAYDFQNLVDFYGNIPYGQASKGFRYLSPKYDTDLSIYTDLSTQLDSAVTLIKNAPATAVALPQTVDVMFGANMTSWAQLANTLRLRLLLHQSEVAGQKSYITGEVAKIVANGFGFLGAGNDALIQPGYTQAVNLQNPFWDLNGESSAGSLAGHDYNRVAQFSLSFFQNTFDPRLDYIVRAPGDAPGTNLKDVPYKAIPFGAPPTTDISSAYTCGFGPGIMPSPSSPVVFISAAQSLFLQAEAAQRGWIAGTPQTLYQSGITESCRLLGVTSPATAAQAYYTSGNTMTDWSTASTPAAQLLLIITQKWAAMYATDCAEAWSDMRRLNNPLQVPLSKDPGVSTFISPIRLLYPQSEYNNNTANVNKEGTVSQFTSKVFWDIH